MLGRIVRLAGCRCKYHLEGNALSPPAEMQGSNPEYLERARIEMAANF